jgi:hypothetical protein
MKKMNRHIQKTELNNPNERIHNMEEMNSDTTTEVVYNSAELNDEKNETIHNMEEIMNPEEIKEKVKIKENSLNTKIIKQEKEIQNMDEVIESFEIKEKVYNMEEIKNSEVQEEKETKKHSEDEIINVKKTETIHNMEEINNSIEINKEIIKNDNSKPKINNQEKVFFHNMEEVNQEKKKEITNKSEETEEKINNSEEVNEKKEEVVIHNLEEIKNENINNNDDNCNNLSMKYSKNEMKEINNKEKLEEFNNLIPDSKNNSIIQNPEDLFLKIDEIIENEEEKEPSTMITNQIINIETKQIVTKENETGFITTTITTSTITTTITPSIVPSITSSITPSITPSITNNHVEEEEEIKIVEDDINIEDLKLSDIKLDTQTTTSDSDIFNESFYYNYDDDEELFNELKEKRKINEKKEEESYNDEKIKVEEYRQSSSNLWSTMLKKLDSMTKKEKPKPIVKVGDRIQVIEDGEMGIVRYIGKLENKKTEKKKADLRTWVGIEFEREGVGKNDGMVFGVRYYQTKPNSSIFVVFEKESFLKIFKIIDELDMLNGSEYLVEDKKWKEFKKTGPGLKWKRFRTKEGQIYYGNIFSNKPQWDIPDEFIEFDKIQDYDGIIKIGDKIQNFMTQNIGVIRYIGKLANCPSENKFKNWVGIEWEIGTGKNDGIAFGVRYYQTKPNSSSFVVFDPDIFLDNFLILDEKEENKQEYYEKEEYDENLWKEFKKTELGKNWKVHVGNNGKQYYSYKFKSQWLIPKPYCGFVQNLKNIEFNKNLN